MLHKIFIVIINSFLAGKYLIEFIGIKLYEELAMSMKDALNKHTPWKIVHWAIGGLIAIQALVFTTLALTLGIASQ